MYEAGSHLRPLAAIPREDIPHLLQGFEIEEKITNLAFLARIVQKLLVANLSQQRLKIARTATGATVEGNQC